MNTADRYNMSNLIIEDDDVLGPYSEANDKENDLVDKEGYESEKEQSSPYLRILKLNLFCHLNPMLGLYIM